MRLAEIFFNVIELPAVMFEISFWRLERRHVVKCRCNPAILVDGPITIRFEILDTMTAGGIRMLEGVQKTNAIQWQLFYAIHDFGKFNAGCVVQGRGNIID